MEESLEHGEGPYVFLSIDGALLDAVVAAAQAQFRGEQLTHRARMEGYADAILIVARAESGSGAGRGEGLIASTFLALLQVALNHGGERANSLADVEEFSGITVEEDSRIDILAGAVATRCVCGSKSLRP